MSKKTFSGIWLCTYKYHSNVRGEDAEAKSYVRVHQKGDRVTFETIGNMNDSYLMMRLHIDEGIDGEVATGTWHEQASQEGYYQSAVRHGALQLFIADDYKRLWGKWLGYDSTKNMQANDWELVYVGESLPEGTEPLLADRPE